MCVCVCVVVAQLCLTLCDAVDWSLPVSSVHGISPVRILEWVDMSPPRGSSRPRDQILVSSTSILPLFQDFFCISNVNYREKDGAFCKIRSLQEFFFYMVLLQMFLHLEIFSMVVSGTGSRLMGKWEEVKHNLDDFILRDLHLCQCVNKCWVSLED